MRYQIKLRLVKLNKTQRELHKAGEARGMPLNYHNFNAAINDNMHTKNAELALRMADEILTEWENKKGGN